MQRLKNKAIIITGAAGGIGASMAKLFANHGANVMATDIQERKLNAWVQAGGKEYLSIQTACLDVTSETGWNDVIKKTISMFGRIDVLVNNAGIYPGFVDIENTDTALWNKIIATNLTGPFLGCRACIMQMKNAGGGSIINVASVAGMIGGNGVAYSSSKAGLRLLSKDLAVSCAKYKIRVNTICPGAVLTPMTEPMMGQPGMEETIRKFSPQGRMAAPIEIAMGALYLASDESTFVTGTDLVIDGGAVAW